MMIVTPYDIKLVVVNMDGTFMRTDYTGDVVALMLWKMRLKKSKQ